MLGDLQLGDLQRGGHGSNQGPWVRPGSSSLVPSVSLALNLLYLLQAAANAKNNQGALKTKLVVAECFADGGPQLKRARPRAQGR